MGKVGAGVLAFSNEVKGTGNGLRVESRMLHGWKSNLVYLCGFGFLFFSA
jgi:hypothetical protein